MKKSGHINKILLIISAVCGSIGVVFLIIAFLMGGSTKAFWDGLSIQDSDLAIGDGEWQEDFEEMQSDIWDFHNFANIEELDIEIGIGCLEFQQYDGEDVRVCMLKEDKTTELKKDGQKLEIRQRAKAGHLLGSNVSPVKILVPQGRKFEEIDLKIGAGEGIADELKAKSIEAEIGAGSLEITGKAEAGESEWTVGTGMLRLNELRSEKTNLECSVGEIWVTMDGGESDYLINGEIGVGTLNIAGYEWDGIRNDITLGNGTEKYKLNADCRTGEMFIDFAG